jgi:transcriptional regulator with XRE-family HTH domain
MAEEFETLAQNLAHHLIDVRQKRGLTQEGLAKLVSLPRSTIANLESGQGNPSLINLAKISAALGVTLEQLLHPPRAICRLVEESKVPVQERSQGQVKVYKLLPDPIPHMEVDRIELKPGSQMKGIPHSSGTKEYFHCIQGEITVFIFSQKFVVKKGDVLAFPGESNHTYVNSGKVMAIGMSFVAMTPVGF